MIPRLVGHASLGLNSSIDAVRYSFIVMDLHHLLLAGLPAHSALPPTTDIQPNARRSRNHRPACHRDRRPALRRMVPRLGEGQAAMPCLGTTVTVHRVGLLDLSSL